MQKRQDDPEYLQVLRNIRNQNVSKTDYDFLRKHCLLDVDFNAVTDDQKEWLLKTKIIMSKNAMRYQWNRVLAGWFSAKSGEGVHIINSIDQVATTITPQIQKDLRCSFNGILQPSLSLVIGMPITVLQNLYKYLNVNNGSEGILRDVLYDATNNQPAALMIEMVDADFEVEGLPKNTILVKRETNTCKKKFDSKDVGWKRHQFPVTEAFCITDYKVQGLTLPSALVKLGDGNGVSAYVKLSRTKNRETTRILDGFTLKDLTIVVQDGYKVWHFIRHELTI
jgi:hypothetical protein